ncbi:hypothetical protein NBRC116591_35520 [Sessilibacter corallicola]|uniref:Uncharacterized protein n=1 Tax=Sessilibacter corallicola TaxID=2904075 RepID=A0ABQ0ADM7_9GAMM
MSKPSYLSYSYVVNMGLLAESEVGVISEFYRAKVRFYNQLYYQVPVIRSVSTTLSTPDDLASSA